MSCLKKTKGIADLVLHTHTSVRWNDKVHSIGYNWHSMNEKFRFQRNCGAELGQKEKQKNWYKKTCQIT